MKAVPSVKSLLKLRNEIMKLLCMEQELSYIINCQRIIQYSDCTTHLNYAEFIKKGLRWVCDCLEYMGTLRYRKTITLEYPSEVSVTMYNEH